jgi:hypothetical protein
MNQPFTHPANGAFAAARIPENVQAIAEQSVITTRETYAQTSAAANGGAKLIEEIVATAQTHTKAIGQKVLDNTGKNADALFAAAGAMARAKTIQEVAALQFDYMQKQFAIASEQVKELFELSAGLGKQTLERMTSTSTKAFERDAH